MPEVATTRIVHSAEHTSALAQPRPWTWPLPRLDGEPPCILAPAEMGLDDLAIGYAGRSSSPSLVPVLVAQDGVIAYAGTSNGIAAVIVDHPGGWSTHYADLAHVLGAPTDRFRRRRKVRVRAGDVLGHAHRASLRVRFGMTQLIDGEWLAVDAAGAMHAWHVLPWFSEPTPRAATRRAA